MVSTFTLLQRLNYGHFFLAINEPSPPLRFARENILLPGLWLGKGKPPFKTVFQCLSEEINFVLKYISDKGEASVRVIHIEHKSHITQVDLMLGCWSIRKHHLIKQTERL
ncbi:hypothetical protein MAR_009600 [Mya arenaria]|uniref:Uncharacterized protein n=1 Tax=Mya arenaria TaxID=6604 RepID=A0ABY7E2L0_MYAAR|nr:hypothetical protein MAR_009600 [Mya arenaria]